MLADAATQSQKKTTHLPGAQGHHRVLSWQDRLLRSFLKTMERREK